MTSYRRGGREPRPCWLRRFPSRFPGFAAVAPKAGQPKDLGRRPGNYPAALLESGENDRPRRKPTTEKRLRPIRTTSTSFSGLSSRRFRRHEPAATSLGEHLFARDPNNKVVRLRPPSTLSRMANMVPPAPECCRMSSRETSPRSSSPPGPTPAKATSSTHGRRSIRSRSRMGPFRDYHAGLIADRLGAQAEAKRRLKAAFDANKSTLRFADAYERSGCARRRGRLAAGLLRLLARRPHDRQSKKRSPISTPGARRATHP